MQKRANKSVSGWLASAQRRELDAELRQLLTFCGLKMSVFKGHSFRIGAASAAAFRGRSDAQIRAMCRWPSYAFIYSSIIATYLASQFECVGGVITYW